jgi:hypothetical protein
MGVEAWGLSPDIHKLVEQMERDPEKEKFRVDTKDLTVDLHDGARRGDKRKEKNMKIEIRTDGEHHHLMVNGQLYSRHDDLAKAEQMRDKLIAEQSKPIPSAVQEIQRAMHASQHANQQAPEQTEEREIER